MWSGAIVDIPAGGLLCDGNNGTPDLRGMFVLGAGDVYDPAETGGSTQHQHTFTSNGHIHNFEAGTAIASGASFSADTSSSVATGTTDNTTILPPYYALAFIVKTL